MDVQLPGHVVIQRRDGRKEVLLHRSLAVISDDRVEIKAARGTIVLPITGIVVSVALGWFPAGNGGLPFWALVLVLLAMLFLVPASVMGLVSAIAGADVIVDRKKGSATWQQGYLGMGLGTKELVPFGRIDYFEVTVEGAEEDRWHDEPDDLRQFALVLVKDNGKRLTLTQVPVPAYGQADGMDRTLAVGNAVAALTGREVRLPEGWELVEIDTSTGQTLTRASPAAGDAEDRKRRTPDGRRS